MERSEAAKREDVVIHLITASGRVCFDSNLIQSWIPLSSLPFLQKIELALLMLTRERAAGIYKKKAQQRKTSLPKLFAHRSLNIVSLSPHFTKLLTSQELKLSEMALGKS